MAQIIPDQFDELEVADGGSDYGYWRIVTDQTGAGTDEWATMPIREKYDMPNNDSQNKKTSEGQIERTVSTKKSRTITIDFQHFGSSGEIYVDIPDAMEGQIVQILLERNQDAVNGKKTYILCMGKLTKAPTPGAGKSATYEFDLLSATDDIDLVVNVTNFPNFTGIGTGATTAETVTQANGSYFGIKGIAVT